METGTTNNKQKRRAKAGGGNQTKAKAKNQDQNQNKQYTAEQWAEWNSWNEGSVWKENGNNQATKNQATTNPQGKKKNKKKDSERENATKETTATSSSTSASSKESAQKNEQTYGPPILKAKNQNQAKNQGKKAKSKAKAKMVTRPMWEDEGIDVIEETTPNVLNNTNRNRQQQQQKKDRSESGTGKEMMKKNSDMTRNKNNNNNTSNAPKENTSNAPKENTSNAPKENTSNQSSAESHQNLNQEKQLKSNNSARQSEHSSEILDSMMEIGSQQHRKSIDSAISVPPPPPDDDYHGYYETTRDPSGTFYDTTSSNRLQYNNSDGQFYESVKDNDRQSSSINGIEYTEYPLQKYASTNEFEDCEEESMKQEEHSQHDESLYIMNPKSHTSLNQKYRKSDEQYRKLDQQYRKSDDENEEYRKSDDENLSYEYSRSDDENLSEEKKEERAIITSFNNNKKNPFEKENDIINFLKFTLQGYANNYTHSSMIGPSDHRIPRSGKLNVSTPGDMIRLFCGVSFFYRQGKPLSLTEMATRLFRFNEDVDILLPKEFNHIIDDGTKNHANHIINDFTDDHTIMNDVTDDIKNATDIVNGTMKNDMKNAMKNDMKKMKKLEKRWVDKLMRIRGAVLGSIWRSDDCLGICQNCLRTTCHVFTSSGYSTTHKRLKISLHFVWPHLIVTKKEAILIRNATIEFLEEKKEDLKGLLQDSGLIKGTTTSSTTVDNSKSDSSKYNSDNSKLSSDKSYEHIWQEIYDLAPIEGCTLKLPFNDKGTKETTSNGEKKSSTDFLDSKARLENRPKVPYGTFSVNLVAADLERSSARLTAKWEDKGDVQWLLDGSIRLDMSSLPPIANIWSRTTKATEQVTNNKWVGSRNSPMNGLSTSSGGPVNQNLNQNQGGKGAKGDGKNDGGKGKKENDSRSQSQCSSPEKNEPQHAEDQIGMEEFFMMSKDSVTSTDAKMIVLNDQYSAVKAGLEGVWLDAKKTVLQVVRHSSDLNRLFVYSILNRSETFDSKEIQNPNYQYLNRLLLGEIIIGDDVFDSNVPIYYVDYYGASTTSSSTSNGSGVHTAVPTTPVSLVPKEVKKILEVKHSITPFESLFEQSGFGIYTWVYRVGLDCFGSWSAIGEEDPSTTSEWIMRRPVTPLTGDLKLLFPKHGQTSWNQMLIEIGDGVSSDGLVIVSKLLLVNKKSANIHTNAHFSKELASCCFIFNKDDFDEPVEVEKLRNKLPNLVEGTTNISSAQSRPLQLRFPPGLTTLAAAILGLRCLLDVSTYSWIRKGLMMAVEEIFVVYDNSLLENLWGRNNAPKKLQHLSSLIELLHSYKQDVINQLQQDSENLLYGNELYDEEGNLHQDERNIKLNLLKISASENKASKIAKAISKNIEQLNQDAFLLDPEGIVNPNNPYVDSSNWPHRIGDLELYHLVVDTVNRYLLTMPVEKEDRERGRKGFDNHGDEENETKVNIMGTASMPMDKGNYSSQLKGSEKGASMIEKGKGLSKKNSYMQQKGKGSYENGNWDLNYSAEYNADVYDEEWKEKQYGESYGREVYGSETYVQEAQHTQESYEGSYTVDGSYGHTESTSKVPYYSTHAYSSTGATAKTFMKTEREKSTGREFEKSTPRKGMKKGGGSSYEEANGYSSVPPFPGKGYEKGVASYAPEKGVAYTEKGSQQYGVSYAPEHNAEKGSEHGYVEKGGGYNTVPLPGKGFPTEKKGYPLENYCGGDWTSSSHEQQASYDKYDKIAYEAPTPPDQKAGKGKGKVKGVAKVAGGGYRGGQEGEW